MALGKIAEYNDASMDDATYRQKLIDSGVRADLIKDADRHELDAVGNICGVYRTSMMEQNHHRYYIEAAEREWEDAAAAPGWLSRVLSFIMR
jgi:hypothetical protein